MSQRPIASITRPSWTALAAGFGSVRQFNDTIRAVYGRTPSELRRRAGGRIGTVTPGTIELRLACRQPFDGDSVIRRGPALGRAAEARLADAWRPWRSYAVVHLWRSLEGEPLTAARS